MRKEINSKSKRKWVAGGLAAFASVALLTTGFATWVVINAKTSDNANIGVSVDTAANKTVLFDFKVADNSIIELKEPKGTDVSGADNVLGTAGTMASTEAPLTIVVTKCVITYGADAVVNNYKNIKFTIDASDSDNYASNVVNDANDFLKTKADGKRGTKGTAYTYIDVPNDISVDLSKATSDGTMKKLDLTETVKSISFKWGSFFGGKSPVQFYNDSFNETTKNDSSLRAEYGNYAVQELNAMKTQFAKTTSEKGEITEFKSIKLVATLSE